MGSLVFIIHSFVVSCFLLFITFYEFVQYYSYYKFTFGSDTLTSYDYIVVGSGPAGSTVALRLAEGGKYTVLLLEAGAYGNFVYDIPVLGPALHSSNLDWKYFSEPQKHSCRSLNDNKSHWTAGRIFGGSARLHNMIYVRGHRKDYSLWYMDKVNYDYNNDVLQYFKKSENQMGIYGGDSFHSFDGPMNVDDLQFSTPLADAVLKAAQLLGFSEQDLNGKFYTGFMKPQVTSKNGKRWTIADTLLEKKMKNLNVLTGAQVLTLLFKGYHEVYGVSFDHYGKIETAIAKKGIILSAGAIGTPKILMLSGIGPEKHLNSIGIEVRKNLPVGENLQDHILTGLDLVTLNESLPLNLGSLMSAVSAINYFLAGKGPWTSPGCEIVGIPELYSFHKRPKLEIMVLPVGVSSDGGILYKSFNIKDSLWNSYFKHLVGKQVVSILPVLLHPKSKGIVRLRSSDVYDSPVIDPNYLSDKEDVETLIEGINIIKKLVNTEPMKKFGAELYEKKLPGCEMYYFDSHEYWECYIRHLTLSVYHAGGTCKMGQMKDPTAVVDFNFKVKGFDNLYIADASVMPTLPSGNIQAAVAMIGERLADILLHKVDPNICHVRHLNMFIKPDTCDAFV